MRILLINHYAGSLQHGMEYRPFYMAREWVKHGHEVTIVAASYSHLRTTNITVMQPITEEHIDGIRYIWIKTPHYQGNGIQRIRNMVAFVVRLYRYRRKIMVTCQPDVIISSSTYPFDTFPAYCMAKKSKAMLIHEVHDLWPLTPRLLGNISKWHPFIFTMQIAEDFAYRNSKKVVSMLPAAKDYMVQHGLKPDSFIYIPNGISIEEWDSDHPIPDEHARFFQEMRQRGVFLIGYAGAHGLANSLDTLIDAAEMLAEQDVCFVLIGQGPEKSRLMERKRTNNLQNVVFLPQVTKKQIPALLREMDALFIGAQKHELYQYGISPNKLMDYMMAGKPVIQAIEAGNDIVTESNAGFTIEAENPVAIACAVKTLMNLTIEEREHLGANGRAYVIDNHDYKRLAEKFSDIMVAEEARL